MLKVFNEMPDFCVQSIGNHKNISQIDSEYYSQKLPVVNCTLFPARHGVFAFFCKYRDRKKDTEPSGTDCVQKTYFHPESRSETIMGEFFTKTIFINT